MTQMPTSGATRGVASGGVGQAAAGIPTAPASRSAGNAVADAHPGGQQSSRADAPPSYPTEARPPAVDVPPDAYQVSEDIVVSDNLVAVTRAGTVVDTKVEGTSISLADGTRVTVATDGTVTLDPDFRNPGTVVDANTMHGPGTYISPNGTHVQLMEGKVVITNAEGEKLTVYPNGSCKIDVPEPIRPQPPTPDVPTPGVPPPAPKDEGPGGGSGGPSGPGGGSTGPSGGGTPAPSDPSVPGQPGIPGVPSSPSQPAAPEMPALPDHPLPPRPATPAPAPTVAARDLKVTPADLLKDAQYFGVQSGNASTVAKSFDAVKVLIKEYGLWFGAREPYEKAATQFSGLYQGASRQMTEISGSLSKAAQAYKDNEDKGEELAEGIF